MNTHRAQASVVRMSLSFEEKSRQSVVPGANPKHTGNSREVDAFRNLLGMLD